MENKPDASETLAEPAALAAPVAPRTVAPVWHTVVLVAAIAAISIHGALHFSGEHGAINRLTTYALTAGMEALMLGWVVFGLRLRKTKLRSLLGEWRWSPRAIFADLGIALVFWLCALAVLGSLALVWSGAETAITHRPLPTHMAGQKLTPDPSQQQALHALEQLAPGNGEEMTAWALLCVLVGLAEEIVFRGYLQRQFIGWARGGVVMGVMASAVVFGGAHGYQGVRNMFLLTVFGALFSVLALRRHSLRAGIIAHGGHDLIAGLALAALRAKHLI